MPAYNLITTIHKPTVAYHSAVGELTDAGKKNLVVAHTDRLVVHVVETEGLTTVYDEGIWGVVEMLQIFTPKGGKRDLLMMVTADKVVKVLQWDGKGLATVSQAPLRLPTGEEEGAPSKHLFWAWDPVSYTAMFQVYSGQLKAVRVNSDGALTQPSNLRLDETQILSLAFIDTDVFSSAAAVATIAVLFQHNDLTHVKTYNFYSEGGDHLKDGSFSKKNLEATGTLLVRTPGGLIVFGQLLIALLTPTSTRTLEVSDFATTVAKMAGGPRTEPTQEPNQEFTAVCQVDSHRFLAGNEGGKLYGLSILGKGSTDQKADLKLEALGYTSLPSTLAWTGVQGLVYVGSTWGDNMLIQMLTKPNDDNCWFDVVDTYANLPALNCAVVPGETGADQLIACCGEEKDAALRLVRNGIGVSEIASLPISGVQSVWSLSKQTGGPQEVAVLSFFGATKVLEVETDEMVETIVPGFSPTTASLHCGNVQAHPNGSDLWLQVTVEGLRLVSPVTRDLVTSTSAPAAVTVAASRGHQLLLARGTQLCYWEITTNDSGDVALTELRSTTLTHEASCASFNPDGCTCVVGLWTVNAVALYRVSDMCLIFSEKLGYDALPRSAIIHTFSETPYLLCGMGDGSLVHWELNTACSKLLPSTKKHVNLGTQQVSLKVIQTCTQEGVRGQEASQLAVFIACDKPTVLFEHNGRLQMTPLNVKSATALCPFNAAMLGDKNHLLIISDGRLVIGSIEGVQKLQIRTLPLPKAYCAARIGKLPGHYVVSVSTSLQIVSEVSGEVVSCSPSVDNDETIISLERMTFSGDSTEYFVAGTAYINPEEDIPKTGRIIVFALNFGPGEDVPPSPEDTEKHHDALCIVCEKEVHGAVFQVRSFQGKLLCSVNAMIHLFKWQDSGPQGSRELQLECSQNCNLVSSTLRVRGDYILVGDHAASITVFLYKAVDSSFEEVGHDPIPKYVLTASFHQDGYLVADRDRNLIMLAYESSRPDTRRLEVAGAFHLGYAVSSICKGCLTTPEPYNAAIQPTDPLAYMEASTSLVLNVQDGLLLGSCEGFIGIVIPLTAAQFVFLDIVQCAVVQEIKKATGADCVEFRKVRARRCSPHRDISNTFVDGTLFEALLNMNSTAQTRVLDVINAKLAEKSKAEQSTLPCTPLTLVSLIDKLDTVLRSH